MTQANREFILTGAVIHSVDDHNSVHAAMLVRDGRIAALGSETAVRVFAAPGSEMRRYAGRTIVPGFIDAHNHLSNAAFEPISVDCQTPPLETLDDVLGAIESHCRALPPGGWVRGFGFQAPHVREQRNPTRGELDEVTPNHAFFLQESNVHAGYANSAALAAVGISACTPDPWGGHIERDARGNPTGTLLEAAVNLLQTASWEAYASADWDRAVDLLERKAHDYLAVGITGVGDACVTRGSAELYRRANTAGRLPITVQQMHGGDHFFSAHDLRRRDFIDRVREADTPMLRGGAMKVFVDPAYPDGPGVHAHEDGCLTHAGGVYYSPEEVRALAVEASRLGIGQVMHGMGNCAIDAITAAYREVRRDGNDEVTLRLEHAFVAERTSAGALATLGIDLVTNPGLIHHDGRVFDSWRRNDAALSVMPIRTMIDAGVRVSFASDHPCGTYSPAEIMWSAVTREHYRGGTIDASEAVSALEALRASTINPAWASGRAAEEGSLEVGKRANFVVLDRDPLAVPSSALRELVVEATYVDGVQRFERPGEP